MFAAEPNAPSFVQSALTHQHHSTSNLHTRELLQQQQAFSRAATGPTSALNGRPNLGDITPSALNHFAGSSGAPARPAAPPKPLAGHHLIKQSDPPLLPSRPSANISPLKPEQPPLPTLPSRDQNSRTSSSGYTTVGADALNGARIAASSSVSVISSTSTARDTTPQSTVRGILTRSATSFPAPSTTGSGVSDLRASPSSRALSTASSEQASTGGRGVPWTTASMTAAAASTGSLTRTPNSSATATPERTLPADPTLALGVVPGSTAGPLGVGRLPSSASMSLVSATTAAAAASRAPALSLGSSPGTVSETIILRDVVFALQGVDGKLLAYDSSDHSFEHFVLCPNNLLPQVRNLPFEHLEISNLSSTVKSRMKALITVLTIL